MRQATILFLVKKENGKVKSVLLAMKKRGFGVGKWNGAGGKIEAGESIEQTAIRETREEINVEAKDIVKVAELDFSFPHNPDWNQNVHVFITESWEGESTESEEMKPQWFNVDDIPYDQMWDDDNYWLPKILNSEYVKAEFTFDKDSKVAKIKFF